ncbi:leucine-zipper-like transcriptional regulator 1 isoform X2 [Convolutriloba macropyga]|uniref:leucine-zipper-like transcriptional regulator 1 isoform X2 n=1 Tax=Convolutriloba macropyga TaxID=536237 RepID=UPI003F523801
MNESARSGIPITNASVVRRTMSSPHSQGIPNRSNAPSLNNRLSPGQPEDAGSPTGSSAGSSQYSFSSQSRHSFQNVGSQNAQCNRGSFGTESGFVQSKDDGCHWALVSGSSDHHSPSSQHMARRSKHTMVRYKDALYVFGGDDGRRMLNDLTKYDIEEDRWLVLRDVQGHNPSPRYHHSAVVYKHSMFIFGGYSGGGGGGGNNSGPGGSTGGGGGGTGGQGNIDNQSSQQSNSSGSNSSSTTNLHNRNDLHEYRFIDQSWHEWTFEGVTPTPRSAHCSFVYNKKLWIFGGYGSHRMAHDRRLQNLNDMWCVSLENNAGGGGGHIRRWECVEQSGMIPPPCCNFPVTLVGNRLFLFSGVSGKEMTNHIFTFNLDTSHWTRISPEHILHGSAAAPQKRYGHTMVEYHRRLYVFGGSVASAHDNLASDLLCFDLDHKSWEKVTPRSTSQPITGRLFHTAVVYQDKMYIFGGTVDFDKRSNELFVFKFPTFPKCTLTEDLLRLLTDERLLRLADVCFTFPDGGRLHAHAVVVAARCTLLKQKILSARREWREKCKQDPSMCGTLPEVFINESNRNAFHLVLQYLYTDRIRPDFTSASPGDELLLQIIKVCKVAAVYKLARLECLCLRFLEETICMDNILSVLSEAYSLQLHALREFCVKKVVREDNFTALIQREHFASLQSHIIVDLIRRHKHVNNQVQYGPPSSPQSSWTTAAQAATGDQQYTAHSPTSQLASFSLGTNQQSYQQQCTMPQQDNHLEEGTLALDLFNLLQVNIGRKDDTAIASRSTEAGSPGQQSNLDTLRVSVDDAPSGTLSFGTTTCLNGPDGLEEFADVQLTFGANVLIYAHRAVLAARSQYFLSLFDFNSASSKQQSNSQTTNTPTEVIPSSNNNQTYFHSSKVSPSVALTPIALGCDENGSLKMARVKIDDIVGTRQALESFLRFVYSGHTLMPPEDSLFLLRTPSFYGLTNDRLAHICQKNLETNITTETVLRVYITVDSIPHYSDFRDRCLHFIVDHFVELGQSEDRRLLSQSQLCEVWEAYCVKKMSMSAQPVYHHPYFHQYQQQQNQN